jgi:hypothetical protein
MEKSGESFVAHVAFPAEGHVAHFAEARFESGKRPFSLCTLVRVDGRTPFGK